MQRQDSKVTLLVFLYNLTVMLFEEQSLCLRTYCSLNGKNYYNNNIFLSVLLTNEQVKICTALKAWNTQ
jgi:hypothetical protein